MSKGQTSQQVLCMRCKVARIACQCQLDKSSYCISDLVLSYLEKESGAGRCKKACTWPEGLQGLELLVQGAPSHNVCIIIPGP